MQVVVSRDLRGIEAAAFELLKAPMLRERAEKLRKQAEGTANAERILSEIPKEQTMADGYYVWAAFLFWLDSTLQYAPAKPGELQASEVEGLRAINAARNRFQCEFMECPKCLRVTERGSMICVGCGFKFVRGND